MMLKHALHFTVSCPRIHIMSVVVFASERFAEHQTPPGHPERPERADAMDVMANRWRARGADILQPSPRPRQTLPRVHNEYYPYLNDETTRQYRQLQPD